MGGFVGAVERDRAVKEFGGVMSGVLCRMGLMSGDLFRVFFA